MHQISLRLPDELAEHVRSAAAARGRSVNGWVVDVLSAAVDPDLATDEAERIRERLRKAGLLAEVTSKARRSPDAEQVARARKAAGRGRRLADIVRENRR